MGDAKTELLHVPADWEQLAFQAEFLLASIFAVEDCTIEVVKRSPTQTHIKLHCLRQPDLEAIQCDIDTWPVIKHLGILTFEPVFTNAYEVGDIVTHNGQQLCCTHRGSSAGTAAFHPYE